MKKLLILMMTLMISGLSFGQITVSGSVGADGSYTSLTNVSGAFEAINGTVHTGANILITVDADVTTEAGTNSINAGAWTSLTINPGGGAARTISGTVDGAPLIVLNGADYITINGLNTGGNSLTISNLSTAATTLTSTIRMIADATNITITNCSVLGSATVPLTTNGGNIFISTGTTDGNDNITISNCLIGPAGANLPSKGIYGNGSTTNATIANSNVTITNCEIFDFFLATGCAGVYTSSGNTDWNITNNKIYQTASRLLTTTNAMTGIYFSSTTYGNNVQITGNTIGYAGNAGTGTLTLTGGAFRGIYFAASSTAADACNLNNNLISDISLTSATGTFYGIQNATGASSNTININDNNIKNITLVTTTGIFYGLSWGSATNMTITGNNIYNITRDGAGAIYGINSSASSVNEVISNNNIYDLSATSASTTSSIYGIYQFTAAGPKTIQNNTIYNLTGNFGNTIYGMSITYGSPANISENTIYNLIASGGTGGTIYGINLGTTGATLNVYKNKIYDISSGSTGASVYGITIAGGVTRNIYNNFISNLEASATNNDNSIRGINITSTTALSNINVYFNSIYINGSSTGTNFGSTGVFHTTSATATTAVLDLRNNIVVNTSTPNGTGLTVAYRRSSAVLTNYASTSNSNAFYAGATEDATHAIFYDGTTPLDFVSYQTLVGPSRDATSFRELPPFIGGAPYDLHLNTAIATYCESGGSAVTTPISVTDDFDGNVRNSPPDVGADEFAGTVVGVINPSLAAAVASSQQIDLTYAPNPSVNNVVIVWNATGTFTAPVGAPPAVGNAFAGGTLLYNGIVSPYNHTGLTPATVYYYKAFSYNGANYSSGVTAAATPDVAAPTAFTATAMSGSQIDLAYTKNAVGDDVIIATNSTSTFGAPVNGTPLNVSDPVTGGGTVIYKGPLAAYNHTSLTATTVYYYKVWSVDAFDYYSATGATSNATTLCNEVALFSENFDGVTTPAFPTCWQKVGTAGTTNTQATNPSSPPNCLYIYSTSVSNRAVVAMPFISNAGAGTHQLRFNLRANLTVGGIIEIGYLTDRNDAATFVAVTSATANTLTYVEKTVWLGTAPGAATTIAFRNTGAPAYSCLIDDVVWEILPSCIIPTAETSSAVTHNSATISWTASISNPMNGYEYEVRTSGAAGSGATGLFVSGTTVAGDVNENITGLSATTTYYVYVRSDCGAGDYSAWIGGHSFTTPCIPVDVFPYTEPFASYLPNTCWREGDAGDITAGPTTISATASSWIADGFLNSGTTGAARITIDAATDNDWIITPLLSIPASPNFQLKYSVGATQSTTVNAPTTPWEADDYVEVLINTSYDYTTWTVLKTYNDLNVPSYLGQVDELDLSAYAGQTIRIAYRGVEGATNGSASIDFFIDNLIIEATPAGIWSGAVSSSWNNTANWTSGTIPTLTDNVVISTGAPNMPIVDLAPATPAVCNDLTINAGATLQVAPGMALTANGSTTVNATGTFTIKSNATGTGSFINVGTITGNASVEKYLDNSQWWYVSTPVAASTGLAAFGTLSSTPSTGTRLVYRDEITQTYIDVVDADVLTPMKGYTFKTFGAPSITANFFGALNTGSYGSAANLSRTGAVQYSGFNLVSNPYPSAINWGSDNTPTAGLTKTTLESTIWYRTNGVFATYNSSADGTGVNGGQQYIPAMQSFWVRVASGNTTGGIQYANTTRVHNAQPFYKTTTVTNVFRMTVSNGLYTDEIAVGFYNNALETYENYDSQKMFSDDGIVPQVYTLTTDNTQAAINGFPILGSSEIRVVPLGISTDVAGTFTLNATNLTDFDASIPVSLEDLTTGTIQDLRQNASYSFTTGIVSNANRFRLHFGTMTTGINETENGSVAIYAYSNTMYVNTPQINSVIDVYDMVGNKVLSQISKSGMNTIQAGLQSGMYLVKVQSNNGVVTTEKVMISK